MKRKEIIIFMIIAIVISITLSFCLAETLIESKNVSYVGNSKLGATNVQNAIDGTCTKFSNELTNLERTLLDKFYPVGSVYISTTLKTATEVQNSFGGTWVSYGIGKTLLSSTTSEQTGGSNTVTLTTDNLPAHTHNYDKVNSNTGSHTLTIAEMPSHSHGFTSPGEEVITFGGAESTNGMNAAAGFVAVVCPQGVCPSNFSSAYNWFRGAEKSMGKIGTTGNDGGHTHTISTTSSKTSSAGSTNPTAINVQNPYITVYMYKRTK